MEKIIRKQVSINMSSASVTDFKLYCKKLNMQMNTIIETFMSQFLANGFEWEIKDSCFFIANSKFPVKIDRIKKTAIITSLNYELYKDFKHWCSWHDVTVGIVLEAFIKHLVDNNFYLSFQTCVK